MATFSDRLKSLRHEVEMTQQELADALGVERSTLSSWEIGRREPDTESMKNIADYFDVSVDYLLGRTDIKKFDLNIENIAAMRSKELEGYDDLPDEAKKMLQAIIKEYYERFGKEKGK